MRAVGNRWLSARDPSWPLQAAAEGSVWFLKHFPANFVNSFLERGKERKRHEPHAVDRWTKCGPCGRGKPAQPRQGGSQRAAGGGEGTDAEGPVLSETNQPQKDTCCAVWPFVHELPRRVEFTDTESRTVATRS